MSVIHDHHNIINNKENNDEEFVSEFSMKSKFVIKSCNLRILDTIGQGSYSNYHA